MSRSPHSRTRAGGLAGILLALAAGCGGDPGPRWIPLARDFEPASLLALARGWQSAAGLDPEACSEVFIWVQLEQPLPASAWQPGAEPGTWTTALPAGAFRRCVPGVLRLEGADGGIGEAPPGSALRAGTLRVESERIVMRLPAGTEPADMRLSGRVESGRRDSDGVWQVRIGNEFGAGIPVWSGHAEELVLDLPRSSRLSFLPRFVSRAAPDTVTLRVRVDGTVVHETRASSAALAGGGDWISVPLPARGAKLALEADGPPGVAFFLAPVVGPDERGGYGARPWPDARPDVVLFLADTFRADGLAVNGGAPELAPRLNRFAATALRFRNARANAAWTLPSIGTLLTGLAPGQHTANETERSLPDTLTTVVESLSRAGYRTGAVTDAAFFTPIHGLEQGFESFVQNLARDWDLDWTLARAAEFLARDDGRPVFLVVHTYRTHMPYRVGPDEDRGPWDALRAAGCAVLKSKESTPPEEWRAQLAGCAPRLRALYHEGVRDLDRGFGAFLDDVERRGLLRAGYLVFTSDHGEALGENDDIFHAGELWDSKLRIPLLVRGPGPGLAPRDVEYGVTLMDLAPTLAGIAGLARDPRWHGTSLFEVTGERPACAFRLQSTSQVALVHGERKLLADSGASLLDEKRALAFDLGSDPREEHPLTGDWTGALAREHAAFVEALLEAAAETVAAPVSGEHRHELDQLGYGGETDQ